MLVVGREENYEGIRVSALQICSWKSGDIVFKMLLLLVRDKSESEDVEGIRV